MKATDIIRNIMVMKQTKPSDLAFALKIKSSTLSERMTQKNMSILKLSEMLRALGYKILIVPRDTKVPTNGFEVTFDDEVESDYNVISITNNASSQPNTNKSGRIQLSKLSREELESIVAEYTKEKLAELDELK